MPVVPGVSFGVVTTAPVFELSLAAANGNDVDGPEKIVNAFSLAQESANFPVADAGDPITTISFGAVRPMLTLLTAVSTTVFDTPCAVELLVGWAAAESGASRYCDVPR
jgi:hypothetical protein